MWCKYKWVASIGEEQLSLQGWRCFTERVITTFIGLMSVT
jgi:hypothetical protein